MITCTHRPPCPGCPRFGEPGPPAGKLERLRAFCAAHGAAAPRVVVGPAAGHRHRARLAVRGRASSPKLGIFQQGSHRIVDIPSCPIHHPAINEAAAAVRRAIRATDAAPYAEGPHAGLVRYVQLVVERSTGRVQVTIVVNAERDDVAARELAGAVANETGTALQGIWLNHNVARGNAILGPRWTHVGGAELLVESVGGARIHIHPGAFGQANSPLADALVAHVHRAVAGADVVAELFAGSGAIGLGLLARGGDVRFNELSPFGVAGLRRGLAELDADAVVHAGRAEEAASLLEGAGAVVVDPPRKGVGSAVLGLLRSHADRLAAVYCGYDSFEREIGELLASEFRLVSADAFDMFPFTGHVEVAAVLERRDAKSGRPEGGRFSRSEESPEPQVPGTGYASGPMVRRFEP